MKKIVIICFHFFYFASFLPGQNYAELKWTKYYETVENKIMGIWPHDSRYSSVSRLKELKYKWGFYDILLQQKRGLEHYNMLIEAGFDSSRIVRHILQDTYLDDVEGIPETWAYYINEPADLNENLTVWNNITNWIKNKNPITKVIISGYKRDDFLKDYVHSIADFAMFSSYKHWWEFLGFWISVPENPDQRADWVDMNNLFGNKFSLSWIGAHKDLSEYDDLMGKAENLQLDGVFLYQHEPHGTEVDDNNFENFCDAAANHGYLNTYFQQVRELYKDNLLVNRKLIGFAYPSEIPEIYDHSTLTFEDYIVTNNRIEDYFGENKIVAGEPYIFKIPTAKKSSFNSNQEITLKPGFHAEFGSEFRAYIGDD